MPILEGFGFGTPVITSMRDPMREVASDAALLVDPTDVSAIADAMRTVVANPELRATLVARGATRVRAFAGSHVAAKLIAIYTEAVQHRQVGRRPLG